MCSQKAARNCLHSLRIRTPSLNQVWYLLIFCWCLSGKGWHRNSEQGAKAQSEHYQNTLRTLRDNCLDWGHYLDSFPKRSHVGVHPTYKIGWVLARNCCGLAVVVGATIPFQWWLGRSRHLTVATIFCLGHRETESWIRELWFHGSFIFMCCLEVPQRGPPLG